MFSSFHVEAANEANKCVKDKCLVTDGDEDGQNLGTYCGVQPKFSVHSLSTSMHVYFSSDNDIAENGFKFSVEFIGKFSEVGVME